MRLASCADQRGDRSWRRRRPPDRDRIRHAVVAVRSDGARRLRSFHADRVWGPARCRDCGSAAGAEGGAVVPALPVHPLGGSVRRGRSHRPDWPQGAGRVGPWRRRARAHDLDDMDAGAGARHHPDGIGRLGAVHGDDRRHRRAHFDQWMGFAGIGRRAGSRRPRRCAREGIVVLGMLRAGALRRLAAGRPGLARLQRRAGTAPCRADRMRRSVPQQRQRDRIGD